MWLRRVTYKPMRVRVVVVVITKTAVVCREKDDQLTCDMYSDSSVFSGGVANRRFPAFSHLSTSANQNAKINNPRSNSKQSTKSVHHVFLIS